MKIYIIGICNNKILMCQNESDFTSGLTIPHVSITGNGKVNDNLGTSNNVPDDIYEKISSVYKEMTNCDIRLYEFVSQKNHNDCCICFVIGRISFGDIENEKVSDKYNVSEIFCCSYAPYFYEGIKIRYPEYTREKNFERDVR